uniref:Uncharacterized protein n=1 Tax=Myotis lucifugus TaxID=59463 RepID=G1QDZ6_MYOLU
ILKVLGSLRELDLSGNSLSCSAVQSLCDALKSPCCHLDTLRLVRCGLTNNCCKDLASMLGASPSLTELDLRQNDLGDLGLKLLCEGLRQPACQLRNLRLVRCGLTNNCCKDLASMLGASPSLTELDLGQNDLGDLGLKRLCEGLRQPACQLRKLRLVSCSLTNNCCKDLASMLGASPSLTELDLGQNDLGDLGVKLLCEGLRQPACQFRKMRLVRCGLTNNCCKDLASMLGASPSLTELDLGQNDLGDLGVKLLCEGLRQPACQLRKLRLVRCGLTNNCCQDLASMLGASPNLTELDLGQNDLGDLGVKLLCEGLRQPACQLRKLRLDQTWMSKKVKTMLTLLQQEKPQLVISS